MSRQTTTENIFDRYKKEAQDSRITKIDFISGLNDLLQRMKLTKPAEMIAYIYYVDGYEDYVIPADFREAIAVYGDNSDVISYVSPFRFRLGDPDVAFTEQVDAGKRYLKIRDGVWSGLKTGITDCDSLTDDGAWTIAGGSGLAIDTTTKEKGSGSVSFSVSSAQATLLFIKTSAIDASEYTEHMIMRLFTWLPTAPSSIVLRVGNDASNYFEQTITAQANGRSFNTSVKNEIEFRESNSTQTGTVDRTDMVWYQFEFNFSASIAVDNFRVDAMVLARPEILELEYYTNYIGLNSSGVLIEKITESAESTDDPIIKEYPDYINVVVDGLLSEFFKVKNPNRGVVFEARFRGEFDQRKKALGGMALINERYPNRRANYKRITNLPPLYTGRTMGGRRYSR